MKRFAWCALFSILGLLVLPPALWSAVASAAVEEGFRPIFDGKTLDGWEGNPKFWRVEQGAMVGETTKENPAKGNTFLIWRGGTPRDFELKAEFKLVNHNSGIQFRSWEEPEKWGKWVMGGYQADMDEGNAYTGGLYGERYRGILAKPGEQTVIGEDHKAKVLGKLADPKEILSIIKKGDWNEYRIVARGNHIIQELNGKRTVDATDDDKEMRRESGLIGLQLHAGPPMKVFFRNIRLKEFTAHNPMKGEGGKKKVVFIAGGPSHGYAQHEHYAGCTLLAKCLSENVKDIETVVCKGWPKEAGALDDADAIVIFSDGGGGQPICAHLEEAEKLMHKGVGLGCIHYAVEVPKGKQGDCLKDWTGGYFETFWSVNPHWKAEFKEFPKHPVANGLKPCTIDDEWYYHMRFVDNMAGVTPILTAVPPDSTRREGNDAHGANEHVRARKGMAEHLGWVRVRPDGGRGFGLTGGHWQWNWASDTFRTFALNAIVWIAKLDVPPGGVPSKTPTWEDLLANLDKKPEPKSPEQERQRVLKMIGEWKKQAAEGK